VPLDTDPEGRPGSRLPRPPGTRVDHYELVEHLADGAQAEVHRAKDTRSGDQVTIKFPHARVLDHPALTQRWRREAALTEALAHPNLQCRRDVGERHSEPYLVFDYAAGGSLDHWIGPDRPELPVGQAVAWGRQLAQALAFLHHLGIIHRDIKLGNILITDELQVKLGDFGAAAPTRRRLFGGLPTPAEGTPEYLSPEQITGRPGDERSDLYGWGVVMYELLTGRCPFTGSDAAEAMTAHLTGAPARIRSQRGDVSPALETVVLHAIRRYPDNRYQSALALLDDLDHLDRIDPSRFDLCPEAPITDGVGGSEAPAAVRLALLVAAGFVAIVAVVIVLTVALR
jgi:serine/threonine-protein kinase